MKPLYMTSSVWILTGLTSVSLILASNSAHAQEQRFSCGQYQGRPTTLAQTKRGQVPVIRWTSDYFAGSGWTPEKRCQTVSSLFEEYHRQGTLNYLTTERDRATRQNVVCVAPAAKAKCTGTLFTLKSGSNPGQTLKRLLDLRVRATSDPLNETFGRVYINMDEFLKSQPVAPVGAVENPSTPTPANSPKLPSQTSEDVW